MPCGSYTDEKLLPAILVAEMTETVPPRLHATLDGKPEVIIQFHELAGVGSIGDPSRGDLMAGFTKAPFYGAEYKKRGAQKVRAANGHMMAKGKDEQIGRASGCPCPSVLVS